MTEQKKRYPNPKFGSLEEEEEYWKTRSPLAEGYKGKVQRSRQRRSSFLAVRLSGEELTRLRDSAAKQGIGPSTFARLVLTSAIEHPGKLRKHITLDQLKDMLENNLPQSVKERAEALAEATAIGDSDSPSLLIIDARQMKKSEELMWLLFRALLSMVGVQVITPEDERYEEVRDIVKTQT